MPLHRKPRSRAEELALHLETNYGIQLDPHRQEIFVAELNRFLSAECLCGWRENAGRVVSVERHPVPEGSHLALDGAGNLVIAPNEATASPADLGSEIDMLPATGKVAPAQQPEKIAPIAPVAMYQENKLDPRISAIYSIAAQRYLAELEENEKKAHDDAD